jgi:hypothetical protein
MREVVRVPSIAPIAVDAAPIALVVQRASTTPPRKPPPRRSPDASLEFPHPVDPALFEDAEDSHELAPDFDDELPPPPTNRSRVRYFAFTGVMVMAGILFGLAIGSRSRASVASDGEEKAETKSNANAKKTELPAMETPKAATTATTTSTTNNATTKATSTPASTVGTIASPKWATGRRVYMDGGKDWGPAGSAEVPCGTHVVQIGASGKPRKVNVPCGGSVTVLP